MKAMCTMQHPDEVSGTYVLWDGTRIYWTEGRSSRFTVIHPDGLWERFLAGNAHNWEVEECGHVVLMSEREVQVWGQVMNLSQTLPVLNPMPDSGEPFVFNPQIKDFLFRRRTK